MTVLDFMDYGCCLELPMVTILWPAILHALLPIMSKADKLPLEMEPVPMITT